MDGGQGFDLRGVRKADWEHEKTLSGDLLLQIAVKPELSERHLDGNLPRDYRTGIYW